MTERRIYKEQPRIKASTNPALTIAKGSLMNPNNNKPKPRPRNRKKKIGKTNNTIVKSMIDHNPVHPCIAQYCSALVDPRNTPQGACIPWGFPMATQRVKTANRGTFALGTTGKGFAYMTFSIANDTGIVTTTASTSVGTNATAANAFTNLTNNTFAKLPYTAAQLNGGTVSGRFVAGGIRIRYAGTEAARNGIVSCYESSQNVVAGQAYNTYGGDINVRNERPPPDGSWHSVYYSGPYNSQMVNCSTNSVWAVNAPLMLYVQGVAGDLYEWEGYVHIEFNGDPCPGTQMTHSDPEGYGKVLESTKKVTVSEPLSDGNSRSTFFDFMKNAGSSVFNYVKTQGMNAALTAVSNYLLPGSGTVTGPLLLAYK